MNGTAAVKITGIYAASIQGCDSEEKAVLEAIEQFRKADLGELSSAEYKDPEAEDLGGGNYRVAMEVFGFYEPEITDAKDQDDLCEKAMEAAIYADFGELTDVDPDITDILPKEAEELFAEEELA